jgi:hypothetical protein
MPSPPLPVLDPRLARAVDDELGYIIRLQQRKKRFEIMAEDGGIAHGLPSQFQIVDIGEVEVLGDEDTDLLALVLFQHRPDVDVVLERDRGLFGRARDIVEIAVAARCGLPGNIGGVIDEREEQRAAEPCPEEAVDRPASPARPSASDPGEARSMRTPCGVTARVQSTKRRF